MNRLLRELIISVLLAFILFFAIDAVTSRSYVEGQSMEPTLHRDQVLLVSRFGVSGITGSIYHLIAHRDSPEAGGWLPSRGSIITFAHPTDPSRILVKRIIGMPGEEISIQGGIVYINGTPLSEPYVIYNDSRNMPPKKIPENHVFVMGDNRPASNDSRSFGPIPASNIVGVAILRYWPINEFQFLIGS